MAAPAAVAPPAANVSYTTLTAPADGYVVERDLGVVFGTAALQTQPFSRNAANRATNVERTVEQARTLAMAEMGQQCEARGGNIIIAATIDAKEFHGFTMVMCSGTACVVKPKTAAA